EEIDVRVEGATPDIFCEVRGEVRNSGDRTLEELEIVVYYLAPDGKPHLVDQESPKPHRAAFAKHWPALPAGVHAGEGVKPMKPGETRPFTLYLPSSFAR